MIIIAFLTLFIGCAGANLIFHPLVGALIGGVGSVSIMKGFYDISIPSGIVCVFFGAIIGAYSHYVVEGLGEGLTEGLSDAFDDDDD